MVIRHFFVFKVPESIDKQVQLLLEDNSLLVDYAVVNLGNEHEEENVELLLVSDIPKTETEFALKTKFGSAVRSGRKQQPGASVQEKKIFVHKKPDQEAFNFYARTFGLKEFSVSLTNIRKLPSGTFLKYGVYDIKKRLKKYEKRQTSKETSTLRHKGQDHSKKGPQGKHKDRSLKSCSTSKEHKHRSSNFGHSSKSSSDMNHYFSSSKQKVAHRFEKSKTSRDAMKLQKESSSTSFTPSKKGKGMLCIY